MPAIVDDGDIFDLPTAPTPTPDSSRRDSAQPSVRPGGQLLNTQSMSALLSRSERARRPMKEHEFRLLQEMAVSEPELQRPASASATFLTALDGDSASASPRAPSSAAGPWGLHSSRTCDCWCP